ncbi:maleylpyruvate isomerase N-terminal domain-containing protein [Streptomyces sp. NPDC086766]|uniref:maleylpyruvate isomerase N-terminal domain-containing protein n=1 Tax=Streptomyces sp. NPDC086766 TaxID=3365754 RepID=UPI0038243613
MRFLPTLKGPLPMTEAQQHDSLSTPAYRTARIDTASLTRQHPADADLPVPACLGWTVRDLLGHLFQIYQTVTTNGLGDTPDLPPPRQDQPPADPLSRPH